MTMIAAVLMSSVAFAQEEKKCECKNCKQPDKTEMVKHRTDRVVKKYGLNDQQAASLLELNTKWTAWTSWQEAWHETWQETR